MDGWAQFNPSGFGLDLIYNFELWIMELTDWHWTGITSMQCGSPGNPFADQSVVSPLPRVSKFINEVGNGRKA